MASENTLKALLVRASRLDESVAARGGCFERERWSGRFVKGTLEEAFQTEFFHANCPLQLFAIAELMVIGALSPYLWQPHVLTIQHQVRAMSMSIILTLRLWAIYSPTSRVLSMRVLSRVWCLIVVVDVLSKAVTVFHASPEVSNTMSMMRRYVATYSIIYAASGAMIPTLGLPFQVQAATAANVCIADLVYNRYASHQLEDTQIKDSFLYDTSSLTWTTAYVVGFVVSHLFAQTKRDILALTLQLCILRGRNEPIPGDGDLFL